MNSSKATTNTMESTDLLSDTVLGFFCPESNSTASEKEVDELFLAAYSVDLHDSTPRMHNYAVGDMDVPHTCFFTAMYMRSNNILFQTLCWR